jgi:hypothetical protein
MSVSNVDKIAGTVHTATTNHQETRIDGSAGRR